MRTSRPLLDDDIRADYPSSTFEIDDDPVQRSAHVIERVAVALEMDDLAAAERRLQEGLRDDPDNPRLLSYLSVCVAAAGREVEAAEELARRIIADHPLEAGGPLALGNVKLLENRRRYAFQNFARARDLARGDRRLLATLDRMEPRRDPVFASLPRGHFLNVWCGRLRAWVLRLGGRA